MILPKKLTVLALLLAGISMACEAFGEKWIDATADAGLAGLEYSRLKFADLNGDYRPDVILVLEKKEELTPRVFLSKRSGKGSLGFVYEELPDSGLPAVHQGDTLVFADLDNDGFRDAILGRYLDIYQDDYAPPASPPQRSAWFPGRGDGTFGQAQILSTATMATTRAIAVGDVNQDGLPDCFIGNWYERYFSGYEGFPNDLLLQYRDTGGHVAFARWPLPFETYTTDYTEDLGGRPTYGAMLPRLDDGLPMLLELNYGRRWNRLYQLEIRKPLGEFNWDEDNVPAPLILKDPKARADHLTRQLRGRNIAAEAGVDGDNIRHGRHPKWPENLASERPRSRRPDEPPFRANGNTFDAAVGDIDNDGDFDLFVSTIIHAWAGESSDRSRFLVNQLKETGKLRFYSFERLSVDRIPDQPAPGQPLNKEQTQYNQGDIYAELADLNHDGRLDLILCSSDYPDPPPHDERLRIYFQQSDGRFADVTAELGIDHIGAGMPSLADPDLDGDLDILIGQSFNRLPLELRRKAAIASGALTPQSPEDAKPELRARLYLNRSSENRASLILYLQGDPEQGVTREAFGTIVRMTADLDGNPETPDVTQIRQVLGPGGHAGKQNTFMVHFGLGDASTAKQIEILWPNAAKTSTVLKDLPAGRYLLKQGESTPQPLNP